MPKGKLVVEEQFGSRSGAIPQLGEWMDGRTESVSTLLFLSSFQRACWLTLLLPIGSYWPSSVSSNR